MPHILNDVLITSGETDSHALLTHHIIKSFEGGRQCPLIVRVTSPYKGPLLIFFGMQCSLETLQHLLQLPVILFQTSFNKKNLPLVHLLPYIGKPEEGTEEQDHSSHKVYVGMLWCMYMYTLK